jgi:diguanylate cyclase (GGDEF)-like protein/PAS domain S-box-containing protein
MHDWPHISEGGPVWPVQEPLVPPAPDPVSEKSTVLIVAAAAEASSLGALLKGAPKSVSCATLAQAIDHLAGAKPDVIVLSVPDPAGLDAIDRLRAAAPGTAIVALTGGNDRTLCELARARGAHDAIGLLGLHPQVFDYALRNACLAARVEQLRQAQASALRTLFDLDTHPMWVCDPATLEFIFANRAAVETYGYDEAAFRGMSMADLRLPSGDAATTGNLPETGRPTVERHRALDGRVIEVEVAAHRKIPLPSGDAWLVQARDVTDERRAVRALEASERRFRDFFEQSTGFICIHDLDGTLLSVNPAAAASLGRGMAELLGTPLRDLAPPHLRFLVDQYLQRVVRSGEDEGFMRVLNRRGEELTWQYRNRVHVDPDGSSCVMGYAQDITELRAVESAFRLSEQRLRTIANTLPLKIAYFDAQQRIVFANEAYRIRYAGEHAGVTGRSVRGAIGEQRYVKREPFLLRALGGERVLFESEEGEGEDSRCFEITFIPEFAENRPNVIGVHSMDRDITLHKHEERRLIQLARVDGLTDLLNRSGFYERLENAIGRSRDQDSLLAVFYLDIDHFKQVNDTHGHAVGDALIRAFAQRLSDKVRASDVIARLGGDEFAVVMEGVPDAQHVRAIGNELVEAMRRPFELPAPGPVVRVGASVGIALGRAVPLTATDFVARADAMLYAAKQAGRGSWRLALVETSSAAVGDASRAG